MNKTYTLSKSALAEAERRSLRRDAGELDGEGQSAGQVRMLMRRMDQFIAQFNSAGRPDGGATCASEDEEEDKEEGRVGRVRGEVSLSPSSYAKNELKKVMPALYCNIVTTSAFASVPTWDPPALSLLHPAEPSGSRPRPMAEALEAAPSAPETASQRQQQQSESPSAQNTRVQALAISSTASPDSSSVSPKVNQSATVPASGPASKLRGTPCTSMDEATLPLSASSSSTSTESLPTVASSTRQEPSFLILKELPSAEGVIDRELEKLGVSNRGETSSHARRQTKNLRFDFKSTRPSPTPSDTSTTAPDMICILYDGASLRSVEFAKKYLIRISENSMSSSSSAKTIACVLIQMKSDVAATAEVVKAIADIRASFEVLHLTFSAYDAFLQRNWRQFASPAMMPQQALVEVQCSRSGEGRFGGCCYCYQCCYSPEVLFKKLFFIGANSSSFVVESFANKARRTFLRRIGYTAAGVAVVAACSFGVSLLFKKHLSPKAQERLTACTEAMLYGVSALIQAGDATLQAIWSHVNFPLW